MGGKANWLSSVKCNAFAGAVVLLVLAKGFVKFCKGPNSSDQYDHQFVKSVVIVLLYCSGIQVLSHSVWIGFANSLSGKGKHKWRNKTQNFEIDFLRIKTGRNVTGYYSKWRIISILLGILSYNLGVRYGNIGFQSIRGNIAKNCDRQSVRENSAHNIFSKNKTQFREYSPKLYFSKIPKLKSQHLGQTLVTRLKPYQNPQYQQLPYLSKYSQLATTSNHYFQVMAAMDSNNKSVEEQTEVIKITEKLEVTNLEESALIIHHNSEGSDTEEERSDCELIGHFILEGRMKFKVVEKNLRYAWDFLTAEEDVKVYEIDQNYMIFNFGNNEELKDYIYGSRPWSIDGILVILHPYDPLVAYTELDWNHQPFWIEIRDLLPELMNQKTVTNMGKIMGEVIDIEPKVGLPESGDYFRVCVNIKLTTPLRRGLLCMTAAKTTKWIGFFYEKQPSKICKDCYILKHTKEDCKKSAANLAILHSQIHFFSSMRGGRKNIVPSSVKQIPALKAQPKKSVSSTRFIPPKDGFVPQVFTNKMLTENQNSNESDSGAILGKRLRTADNDSNLAGASMDACGVTGSASLTSPPTALASPSQPNKLNSQKKSEGDKGVVGASGARTNMEL